jgi:hypothetical protein
MTENDDRHSQQSFHGLRSIGGLVPTVTRDAFRRSAPGVSQILEAWPGIVGPVLAAATTPRRLTQGTLTIGCSGPMAMELQHLATEVMQRINRYLGSDVVRRLRFLQTTGLPKPHAGRPQSARALRTIERVSSLPDGPLREALISLGSAILSASAP